MEKTNKRIKRIWKVIHQEQDGGESLTIPAGTRENAAFSSLSSNSWTTEHPMMTKPHSSAVTMLVFELYSKPADHLKTPLLSVYIMYSLKPSVYDQQRKPVLTRERSFLARLERTPLRKPLVTRPILGPLPLLMMTPIIHTSPMDHPVTKLAPLVSPARPFVNPLPQDFLLAPDIHLTHHPLTITSLPAYMTLT